MTTSIILHHGGQIALPRGRLWIGDPKAAGIDGVPPAGDLDGLYVRDGIVAGVFCRSMFDDAEYGIDDDGDEIGLAALGRARGIDVVPTLRARGPGIAIVALDGMPGIGESLPLTEIHGFVLDFPADLQIERHGTDMADIEISATGSPIVRLHHYVRRVQATAPTSSTSVGIALTRTAEPSSQEAYALERAASMLIGRDHARRLISQGGIAIPVHDTEAADRLVAAFEAVARDNGRHVLLQARMTTDV